MTFPSRLSTAAEMSALSTMSPQNEDNNHKQTIYDDNKMKETAARRRESAEQNTTPRKPSLVRRGSFSEVEAFFLHQLLIDDDVRKAVQSIHEASPKNKKFLTDEVLLSVPPSMMTQQQQQRDDSPTKAPAQLPPRHQKAKRRSTKGLWQAHASGVSPRVLKQRGSLVLQSSFADSELDAAIKAESSAHDLDSTNGEEEDDDDAASDQEVRPEKVLDEISVASSWDEEEEQRHFNTWEVLRDEYAIDFGFDYNTARVTTDDVLDEQDVGNTFKIIGTDANDVHSTPHVMSPPLMDALMNFLPPEISGENYWMRYSLIRDGASLDTLKEYVRAAPFTLMAIETPDGQVFGSFTSTPWRNHLGFFGGSPAFVWKMRHSRRSKCASLFDQAQLESEIDVFVSQGGESMVQVCRHDALCVGGDDGIPPTHEDGAQDDHFNVPAAMENIEEGGFAIALEEDLMCGTTSPSRTFKSPSLCGPGDKSQVFNVAGLEIWSFTPCMDVKSAEKLEMTKYFIEESMRGASTHSSDNDSSFSSRDLRQDRFYRRVGDDYESAERRERWQYVNMMNGVDGGGGRAFGAAPRFMS